jgi:hypothetical protein
MQIGYDNANKIQELDKENLMLKDQLQQSSQNVLEFDQMSLKNNELNDNLVVIRENL